MTFLSYVAFKLGLLSEAKEKPTFVSVRPDAESIRKIRKLETSLGLTWEQSVKPVDLHATVIYSREPIADPSPEIKAALPIHAVGDHLHVFKTRDGKDALVLKLASVALRALHHEIRINYGASHDFPTFEAHVTLCYDLPDGFHVPSEIELITLTFDTFEVKELDLEWKPS